MRRMGFEWWQEAVFYQIYPRSFMDSDGDGIGDLAGITARLDYLSDTLGVDAIWISPFYPSPMADFGYDVSNYVDVDPLFGSLDDFDALLAAAHGWGMKVVIDWVPNHSSEQHPWFLESRSSRDNPKRDWYIWRDPAPDGSEPNNWASIFGGPAWEYDRATGQYYMHTFLAEQPDINWRNPEAKAAMLDTLRFWLERGVDGFRLDACHYSMKDPQFRDNPVLLEARQGYKELGDYDRLEHLHDRNHPDIHPLFREIRALLDEYSAERPRFSIGEIHLDWHEWVLFYGDGDELHMPFNFALVGGDLTVRQVREVVETQERIIPPGAWPNYVLGNHDEPRIATRLGLHLARLAAMMLLTLRGTPTLYYGDELGMEQAFILPEEQQDPWGRRMPGLGRDGCRTPMQWEPGPGAGFTAGRPWLAPLDPDGELNVQAQLDDPDSTLNLTRRLLALRKRSAALRRGSYQTLPEQNGRVFAYRRVHGQETVEVYLNLGDIPATINARGEVLAASSPAAPASLTGATELPRLQGLVIQPSQPPANQ